MTRARTISQHNRQTQTQPPRYQGVTIALTYRDRQDLYQRIDQRVDQMMARGLGGGSPRPIGRGDSPDKHGHAGHRL